MDRRSFIGAALSVVAVAPLAAHAQDAKLRIATIGAGREGGALDTRFAKEDFPC